MIVDSFCRQGKARSACAYVQSDPAFVMIVDLFCGESRARSDCTYVQSHLALHSPRLCQYSCQRKPIHRHSTTQDMIV